MASIRELREAGTPAQMWIGTAALALMLTMALLGPLMTITSEGQSASIRQIGYGIAGLGALIAVRAYRQPERLLVLPWPFAVALAWFWLSLTWAIDPVTSAKRLVLTTIVIWSAFALVRQLGYERSLLLVRAALLIALITSFIAVFAAPNLGKHSVEEMEGLGILGNWRGIMAHKNIAGLHCALTILFFAFDRKQWPPAIRYGAVAAAAIFLFFTESKTSIRLIVPVAALGALLAWLLVQRTSAAKRLSDTSRALWVGGVLAVVAAVVHFGIQSPATLAFLSDPSALTGRSQIWFPLVRYYLDNVVTGAGYGSFWGIGDASPILRYGTGWVKTIDQGHNGYLDLLTQVGMPGLIAALGAAFVWPVVRLLRAGAIAWENAALLISVILLCFVHNFSETSLFDRDTIGQVFLMIVLAMVSVVAVPTSAASTRTTQRSAGGGRRPRDASRRPGTVRR